MSPGGGGKPLFDLMPNARQAGSRLFRPRAEREESGNQGRPGGNGRIEIPLAGMYLGIACLLVLLIGGYALGYRAGTSAERRAVRGLATRDAERFLIDDPLSPASETGPSAPDQPRTGQPAGGSAPVATGGEILTAEGLVRVDPRIVGQNYLELATLTRGQAEDAVRYLASRGERAIAVRVPGLDRGRTGRNTSDRYRVVALGLSVPGERFRSSAREREAFEQKITRLGRAWAEQGGASDFSSPLWRRFDG
jgi:hypothetical protein